MESLDNAAPQVHGVAPARQELPADEDDGVYDPIDVREVFGVFYLCGAQRMESVVPTGAAARHASSCFCALPFTLHYCRLELHGLSSLRSLSFFPLLLVNTWTDLLRGINDPEHPLTLEELNVIQQGVLYRPSGPVIAMDNAQFRLAGDGGRIVCLCSEPAHRVCCFPARAIIIHTLRLTLGPQFPHSQLHVQGELLQLDLFC